LGTLGLAKSVALGMNSAGDVVGYAYGRHFVGDDYHAFIYSQGQQRDLHESLDDRTKASRCRFGLAQAVNNSGDIVGGCEAGRLGVATFIWRNGKVIGPIVGENRRAVLKAINNSGDVVGVCLNADGSGSQHACRYKDFAFADLPSFNNISDANAINDSGQIAGDAFPDKHPHAVVWTNDVIHDLGTLAGGDMSVATCINASGQIVGWSRTAADETHAFLYREGVMKDLGTLGGDSEATAINASGQIVGNSRTNRSFWGIATHAFLYQNGVMTDLNSLVTGPLADSVTLQEGVAINDSGFIAATGLDRRTGAKRAYLLVPEPEKVP
jgi:probable HAF family extracellular repeat protein